MSQPLILILGGARSGKSRFALKLAHQAGLNRLMVATAEAGDAEMAARIDRHRHERDSSWRTIEEPIHISDAIAGMAARPHVVVIDCLTLWLSNLLSAGHDPDKALETLLGALARAPQPVIAVSNEVGLGIVPADPATRAFRDAQGRLNSIFAEVCTHVYFMVAGMPLTVKPTQEPRPFEGRR